MVLDSCYSYADVGLIDTHFFEPETKIGTVETMMARNMSIMCVHVNETDRVLVPVEII